MCFKHAYMYMYLEICVLHVCVHETHLMKAQHALCMHAYNTPDEGPARAGMYVSPSFSFV